MKVFQRNKVKQKSLKMNLYHMCLSVIIKYDIEVEERYVEVKKLLREYKELKFENLSSNLLEIKLYLNELDEQQSEDLIQKHYDNEEIICIILRYYCDLFYFISDRLKNKKKNNFNCCSK